MAAVSLITGVTGQDGSYLSELLLDKGYVVYGMIRRISSDNTSRVKHLLANDKFKLVYGDITDFSSIGNILREIKAGNPQVILIFNLCAQSHVGVSFENSLYTANVNSIGVLNILEVIRQFDLLDKVRFYQASTSEMFGKIVEKPQTEKTPFYPRSPYGVSKLSAHWFVKNYREAYNLFACNGVLYNHESPRRGEEFVSRKITLGINDILQGKLEYLEMGNINSLRDWGHAKEYVRAMYMILQQEEPDDYVIATGQQHSVREFIEKAFKLVGYSIKWRGEGIDEEGYDEISGRLLIKINPKHFRPSEVDDLLGDSSYAKEKIGWVNEISFDDLVKEMVECDCKIKL